jgi:hypothetical protein
VETHAGRTVDHAFTLFAETPFESSVSIELQHANVVVHERSLVITSPDERTGIVMTVEGAEAPDDRIPPSFRIERYEGAWLRHRWGKMPAIGIGNAKRDGAIAYSFCDASINGDDCLPDDE